MKHFAHYQLPAILYALIIFVGSSIPTLSPPPIGFEWDDKIYHFLEYAIFGYLCARAFYYQRNPILRDFALIIALVAGSLYAVSDELHQSYVPGRYAEVGDFLADVLGVVASVVLFARVKASRKKSRRRRVRAPAKPIDEAPAAERTGVRHGHGR